MWLRIYVKKNIWDTKIVLETCFRSMRVMTISVAYMRKYSWNSFGFNEVSDDLIFKLLKSLDVTKSTGYDKIPTSLRKTAAAHHELGEPNDT